MATKAPTKAAPKTQAKAPAKTTKAPAKTTKAETKAAPKKGPIKLEIPKKKTDSTPKTIYHVSKRDNDGREWKVFIQGSDKVIKLFDTQAEALEYAQSLAQNKNDGSSVVLHGLNGKIRKV